MSLSLGTTLGLYEVTAQIGEEQIDRALNQRRDSLLSTPVALSSTTKWS